MLIPRAHVLTPNLPEAADLLGCAEARDADGMTEQARQLINLGARAVLLKGGHLGGPDSPDLLMWHGGLEWLRSARIDSINTHGTGCTLSSAIAAHMGAGLPILESVQRGKAYVTGAIASAHLLDVGHGHGPTHHFHQWQK
jgi:hydroxymethylpyrimidine/phosphomethylpyrimidine kinase